MITKSKDNENARQKDSENLADCTSSKDCPSMDHIMNMNNKNKKRKKNW